MNPEPGSREEAGGAEGEEPGRPWAYGIGILILGLFIATIGNAVVLVSEPGPFPRAIGATAYAAGVFVAGAGIHRLLWYRPSRLARWHRLLITGLVTIPAFALTGMVLSFMLLTVYLRFTPG